MASLSYLFYLTSLFFLGILQPSHSRLSYNFFYDFWSKYSFTLPFKMAEKTPKDWVDGLVRKHKVVVFSKSYCPYCTRAKDALKKLNLEDLHVEELDSNSKMDEVQDYLNKLTGARSVPRVFVNGQFYGDSTKTVSDVESGKFMEYYKKSDL
uniref:Glutaredoxin, putative n=1 Tax=Theileria annulata TaxID=5874 RepID=A0A3B0N0J3_THEAN